MSALKKYEPVGGGGEHDGGGHCYSRKSMSGKEKTRFKNTSSKYFDEILISNFF